jgi:long-chain acyl-CoA synthetase
MLNEAAQGVMEGGGSYNRHALVQAQGGSLALPLLEQVVSGIALDGGDDPVVIADYGSSQGKNSLAPMRTAIRALRARLGPDRAITVTHVDQPANDFNTLFAVLHHDADRYAASEPNVFPAAIGRSFYEQVFPAGHVHLGWSSYAAMWLSCIPTQISGHFRAHGGTADELAAFRRQATKDWESFLTLRARELRLGGRLVVVLSALDDDGISGLDDLMDEVNAELADMVSEGAIRAQERARMVIPTYARRRADLLAPFDSGGQFHGLSVECCELSSLADPGWAAYERNGDQHALAATQAALFRATFAPTLACAFTDPGSSRAFIDRLESGLKRRMALRPAPLHTYVQAMVLAKRDGASVAAPQREIAQLTDREGAASSTLGELLHARTLQDPDAVALLCDDQQMTYRQLDVGSSQLALWMIERGLKAGDRVAIHWPNSIEAVQVFFAVFKAGLIAVPINLRLKAPEVAWILEHSQPMLCFSEPSLAPLAEQGRASCGALQEVLTHLPELPARGAGVLPEVHEQQPAVILYTSGSTARPKGAVHTHRTLLAAVRLGSRYLLRDERTSLVMTPIMHALGLGVALLPAIDRGAQAVLLSRFDAGAALDAIERFRCSFTITMPALMQLVVTEQERQPRDVSSLRTALAGGDSVPAALQVRFASLFGIPLQEGVGMTESFLIAFNPKGAIRPGSMGVPAPGAEVGVIDKDDRLLEDGETGELVVRSPANCTGYWNDPAATGTLLRGGWLHSADLAARDSDGYYWFKGRKKEIIVHGGSNVSPQEVEEVLYQYPAVFEAGVIGAPDPVCGERIIAFVSLRNGDTCGEHVLREHARHRLADYKLPERILFLPELPKGTTGKVNRAALKAMLRDDHEQ